MVPVIVVTRLRLRDPAFFDEFFASAVAATEQAQNSDGSLGADVLAEANNTYWTRSAWRERGAIRTYMRSEPHLGIMGRLDEWCDEATFAGGPGPHGRPSHSIIPVTRPYLPRHWLAG